MKESNYLYYIQKWEISDLTVSLLNILTCYIFVSCGNTETFVKPSTPTVILLPVTFLHSSVCLLVLKNLLVPTNSHKREAHTLASQGHPQSPWERVLFYVSLVCLWSDLSCLAEQLVTTLCQHVFNPNEPYARYDTCS